MSFKKGIIYFSLIISFLHGEPLSFRDQMKMSLDHIAFEMSVYYAPAEWKQAWFGWDLQYELAKAKNQIDSLPSITLKDYQRILRNFLATTKDYHVSVEFISTEESLLPFRIKGSNGKYYLSTIERSRLPYAVFPFNVGDEVVEFNKVAIGEAIQKFKTSEGFNNMPLTDQRLAEIYLTHRFGSKGHIVPKGKVTLGVIPKGKNQKSSADIEWIYFAEEIAPPFISAPRCLVAASQNEKDSFEARFPNLARHKMMMTFDSKLLSAGKEDLGSRESFLPLLGKKVWDAGSDNPFDAYIFKNEKGTPIGYLRIPTFFPSGGELEALQEILNHFQVNTKALVIDQMNNPGGSVLYLYSILSYLSQEPLKLFSQRALITQQDVMEAIQVISFIDMVKLYNIDMDIIAHFFDGLEINTEVLNKIQSGYQKIVNEWDAARFLTDDFYLYGLDTIAPSKACSYTRPILVLTNELDFSCADFFPSILQDNKRAKLFGTTTAGAGGYVLEHRFSNRLGIYNFMTTGSIAQRENGLYIENNGVKPDIVYEITQNDLKGEYQDLKKAVLKATEKL
jgi:hypothetical protein